MHSFSPKELRNFVQKMKINQSYDKNKKKKNKYGNQDTLKIIKTTPVRYLFSFERFSVVKKWK